MVLLRAFGHRKNDKFISYMNSTNFLVVQNNCLTMKNVEEV